MDRTQPGLPLKPGRFGTFTHDYKRHGTTTLFDDLQVAEGRVIGECYQRHRHQEFLRFLKRLDRELPSGKALHLILDNYGTHGHPKVREWLARHPRFVLHFIPTSSSWLNLVERWFAELTQKSVRCGSFHSVDDLEQAIAAFLDVWNANPTPLRVDGQRGKNLGEGGTLSPAFGPNRTRMRSPQAPTANAGPNWIVICGTLH